MDENYWRNKHAKDQIKATILEQFDSFWNVDTGIERTALNQVIQAGASPHAVIVSGLRRVGKSTLLAQMAHRSGNDGFYYINFEDDRFLGFTGDDVDGLFEIIVEVFGDRRIFIIDEIQNVPGWEHFVRRFMDLGYKFYITGSNASLLSREMGTRLTGRYIPIGLFPFSFKEYLSFIKAPLPTPGRLTNVKRAELNAALVAYMEAGGIPDALKYPELPILRSLFDDVLHRDIAARYQISAVTALKELGFSLMSNPSGQVSYNRLKGQLRLGSVNTIISFIEYLENSWLIFPVNLYDYSLKRQQIAAKKIYLIDTGMSKTVGFHFSPNSGKMLENLVFLALRRQTKDIYYLMTPGGYEIDFYLPEHKQIIQVTNHLSDPDTRKREMRALQDAIASIKVDRALVIADKPEDDMEFNGVPVTITSAAEWMLGLET